MPDVLEYPHTVLERNELRRVLGNLPAAHPQQVLDDNLADREQSIRDERLGPFKKLPVSVTPYPTSRTLAELKSVLDEDPASHVGAETQFTGQPHVGATNGANYTERHIAALLTELIDLGFVVENHDGSFSMTIEGHAALCE